MEVNDDASCSKTTHTHTSCVRPCAHTQCQRGNNQPQC